MKGSCGCDSDGMENNCRLFRRKGSCKIATQALTDGNTLKNAHTARSLARTLLLLPYLSLQHTLTLRLPPTPRPTLTPSLTNTHTRTLMHLITSLTGSAPTRASRMATDSPFVLIVSNPHSVTATVPG